MRFTLDERAFSHWSPVDRWDVTAGCHRIGVGAHSRDLALHGIVGRGAPCDGALEIPRTSKSCTSRRVVTITLPRGMVDLCKLKAGRVTVRVRGRTTSGRKVTQTRIFRTCAAKRS